MAYKSKEELVEAVRRLAKSIDENADDIVGHYQYIRDIDISLYFPQDEAAYYTVHKEYVN